LLKGHALSRQRLIVYSGVHNNITDGKNNLRLWQGVRLIKVDIY